MPHKQRASPYLELTEALQVLLNDDSPTDTVACHLPEILKLKQLKRKQLSSRIQKNISDKKTLQRVKEVLECMTNFECKNCKISWEALLECLRCAALYRRERRLSVLSDCTSTSAGIFACLRTSHASTLKCATTSVKLTHLPHLTSRSLRICSKETIGI